MLRRLNELSVRDVLLIVAPVVLVTAAGFWAAAKLLKPAPPDRVVMATGPSGGAYMQYGETYRRMLAEHGVALELRVTQGSVDNYALLRDDSSGVDVALLQAGIGQREDAPRLVTLASVAYEPLWVFCRGSGHINRIPELAGRRIAIGAQGSATRVLALEMLRINDLMGRVDLLEVPGVAGAEALLRGEVDCQFLIGAPEAGLVQALIHVAGLTLMSFERAGAYARRMQYLDLVTLPEGVIDLARNLPSRQITLLAGTAQIVARESLHPAIQDLLLVAATQVHGRGNLLHRGGRFPALEEYDFPISPEARRFFRSGQSFLQRYLPFWLANLVDRFLISLIPLAAVLIPVFRLVPPLYRWRVRSRIYRWYGELMFIENETRAHLSEGTARDFGRRLDAIAATVDSLTSPLAYADQLYSLRQHIEFVRRRLAMSVSANGTPPPEASP